MIDKYKNGALSAAEMAKVEEELLKKMMERKEDEAVRQSLRQLAATLDDAKDTDASAPKMEHASVEKPKMQVVHRNRWRIWAAAATVLLLLGTAWWFLWRSNTIDLNAEALAAQYVSTEKAPILSNVMADDTITATEQAARDAYIQGDYAAAVRNFEALPPSTAAQFFYLGIALLKQPEANYSGAIDNLLQARKLGNGWQEDAINWHLALLYLGQKNTSKARKELEHIISVGRDNVAKANLLLKKL